MSKYVKKLQAVRYLGGKCKNCGDDRLFCLTFHHRDPSEKESNISLLKELRWSIIQSELDKCDLLCQNCHREVHYIQDNKDGRRISKSIYLEYAGGKCIDCGYNKCPAALTFHHRFKPEKKINIGSINKRYKSIYELCQEVKDEIDKCDLLCANCHVIRHSDIDYYELHKEKIESKKIRKINTKLNRDEIYKMYDNGIKQIEISRHFNCSKGTICDILKNRKINSQDI